MVDCSPDHHSFGAFPEIPQLSGEIYFETKVLFPSNKLFYWYLKIDKTFTYVWVKEDPTDNLLKNL